MIRTARERGRERDQGRASFEGLSVRAVVRKTWCSTVVFMGLASQLEIVYGVHETLVLKVEVVEYMLRFLDKSM